MPATLTVTLARGRKWWRPGRVASFHPRSANIYQAFINEVSAQSGKGIDPTAAAIMIADAQYLIAHCP